MIQILLLCTGTGSSDFIREKLESEGIRVARTRSMFRMHDLLAGQNFDAVIVEKLKLGRHCINPMRHLWNYRSPLSIISYSIDAEGIVRAECASIPDTETLIPASSDRADRNRTVLEALSGPITIARTEPVHFPPENRQFPEMHQKMKLILEALVNAGITGIAPAAIAASVWGDALRTRKKDLQSYISKLRTLLISHYGKRYSIDYSAKRYILRDHTQSAPLSEPRGL